MAQYPQDTEFFSGNQNFPTMHVMCQRATGIQKIGKSIGRLIISVYSRKHPIPVLGYLRSVQGRQRYHLSSDTLSIQWTELTETWKEDFAEVW